MSLLRWAADQLWSRAAVWDRRWAEAEARRFEQDRERRRGTTGRVLPLDTEALLRLTRPQERPLLVHHLGVGALDGLEVLGEHGPALSDAVDLAVVAWRGDRSLDDVERVLQSAVAGVGGRWRILLHTGEDSALQPALGEPPPPSRTLLLDVDGGVLRVWTGPPDAARMRAVRQLADDASP